MDKIKFHYKFYYSNSSCDSTKNSKTSNSTILIILDLTKAFLMSKKNIIKLNNIQRIG